MNKLGSHVRFTAKRYLASAAEEALSYNASAMMIYLGAPQNTRRALPEMLNLAEYEAKYQHLIPKANILVHAPYIINPASVEKYQFAIEFLVKEIQTMNYLGLKQIVLHPGAHTKFTREEGITTLVKSLKAVLAQTKDVEILLETMAGKGTELGVSFEELKTIIDQVNSPRIKICLDTCHMWDAGYDVNNVDKLIEELKKSQIYSLVAALHINDSKNLRSAHKDRHANLKTGYIKLEALRKLIRHPGFKDLIMVLETPYVEGKPIYKEELELLVK